MYCVYKVLENDTIGSLSERFCMDIDTICSINRLSDETLNVGDLLILPKNSDMYFDYYVSSGDSLYDIANMYNVDANVLYAINGLDNGDFLYENQRILIPKSGVNTYLTVSGDTIGSVSNKMMISENDIINHNRDLYLLPEQLIVYKKG